jgi:hypothetical protein
MAALATIPTTAASTPAQDELDVMIGSDQEVQLCEPDHHGNRGPDEQNAREQHPGHARPATTVEQRQLGGSGPGSRLHGTAD